MNNQTNVQRIQPTGIFTNYIFKALPLAFDESMSYYECLCNLLDYLKNTVIPAVNNNADATAELQEKFIILKDYVDNYFTNLDVQEEINNKMDAMVEDGTLAQILNVEMIGTLSNLTTTDKTDLVSAINEVNGNIGTLDTDLSAKIGDLTNLTTSVKTDVVSAVNSLQGDTNTSIGTLSNLQTQSKTNLVTAINEVDGRNNFTTQENIVGKWTDNKKIYRHVLTVNNLTPDADDTKTIAHGIPDFDKLISLKCIAYDGVENYFDFNNYTWYGSDESTSPSTVHVLVNDTNILVVYQGALNLSFVTSATFIIEYTKLY